jgi:hypothetical protein
MKCIIVPVIIFITIIMFLGCSAEKAIEKTISDFEDAINSGNSNDFDETLSTESDYRTSDPDGSDFLDYFLLLNYDPVHYGNLDISRDGRDADVYSDGTYENGLNPTDVLFWMRREEAFFAFISQDWRIYRYYHFGDYTNPVWRKPIN